MKIEGIGKRSKQCMADLLDLSEKYNRVAESSAADKAIDLSAMPMGLKLYCKIAFDVRGIIQLSGNDHDALPTESDNMDYGRRCWKLYFLHGVIGKVDSGTPIGEYCIKYSDGISRNIPIIFGADVADSSDDCKDEIPYNADVAWPEMKLNDEQYHEKISAYKGPNNLAELVEYQKKNYSKPAGRAIAAKVFCFSVINPRPEVVVEGIVFKTYQKGCAPFLMAATLQPNETVREGFYDAIYFDASKPINPLYSRDEKASKKNIDLSEYYTASLDDDFHFHPGHDLQEMPKGLIELCGTTFDIRGLIQLAAGDISLWRTGAIYLEEVKGIKVSQCCEKIHFIHASGWNVNDGIAVGEYVAHYKNGEVRHIPLKYKENIFDWGNDIHTVEFDSNTKVAWTGTNSAWHNAGKEVNLQKFSWENPFPHLEIDTIDFISFLEAVGPFLVAITLED
jgi:hypothetical protein